MTTLIVGGCVVALMIILYVGLMIFGDPAGRRRR